MLASDGRRLTANDDEQRVLRQIHDLRADGRSLRQIAADLNQDGVRTRSGGPWRHSYVQLVLSAPDADARAQAVLNG